MRKNFPSFIRAGNVDFGEIELVDLGEKIWNISRGSSELETWIKKYIKEYEFFEKKKMEYFPKFIRAGNVDFKRMIFQGIKIF